MTNWEDRFYILDPNTHETLKIPFGEWCQRYDYEHNGVAWTGNDDQHISTVFLGLDHNWGFREDPVLFESMVFGGKHDELQTRYCTYDEAMKGHAELVKLVFSYELEVSDGSRTREV